MGNRPPNFNPSGLDKNTKTVKMLMPDVDKNTKTVKMLMPDVDK